MAKKKKTRKRTTKKPQKKLFIGVDNPDELRRMILEPNREVVHFLQSYEEFKRIKNTKTQTILGLKDNIREIKSDITKLRKLLPAGKETHKKRVIEELEEKKPTKKVRVRSEPSELDELERELAAIEQKLGTIS